MVYRDQKTAGTIPRAHFGDGMTLLCFRWHLRYSMTSHDVEESMAERGSPSSVSPAGTVIFCDDGKHAIFSAASDAKLVNAR